MPSRPCARGIGVERQTLPKQQSAEPLPAPGSVINKSKTRSFDAEETAIAAKTLHENWTGNPKTLVDAPNEFLQIDKSRQTEGNSYSRGTMHKMPTRDPTQLISMSAVEGISDEICSP